MTYKYTVSLGYPSRTGNQNGAQLPVWGYESSVLGQISAFTAVLRSKNTSEYFRIIQRRQSLGN